jgi:hypothetical protein
MRFCFAPPAHAFFALGRSDVVLLDFRVGKPRPVLRIPEKEWVVRLAVHQIGDSSRQPTAAVLAVATVGEGALCLRAYAVAAAVFAGAEGGDGPGSELGAARLPVAGFVQPDIAPVVVGASEGACAVLVFLVFGPDVFCFRQPLRPAQLALAAQLTLPRADFRVARVQSTPGGVWLWVADRVRSIALLSYDDSRRRIELIAEEGGVRLVSAIVGDARGESPAAVAGDRAGNVCRFEWDAWRECGTDPGFFGARKRLRLAWNYFIGEAVTCVACSKGRWRYTWYHTVGGAFGGFMALDEGIPLVERRFRAMMAENLKLLHEVELALADHFFVLTKCDQMAFRNACFPATGTVDLDLLEWFSRISHDKREEIANQQNKKAEEIEIVISQMKAYFWQW